MHTTRRLVALIGVAVLGLAACGDDSDDDNGDDVETEGDETTEEDTEGTDEEATGGTLTVCSDAPYPPFEFQDDDGTWTGFDMELMREIASRMNMEMEVSVQDFDGILLALNSGNCDIVASAMTITEERAENALFSDGYFAADQSLLIPKEHEGHYETLDDLAGESIGVQSGTTGKDYADANAPDDTEVRDFTAEADIFLALESGEVSAVLQDLPANGFQVDENPDKYVVVEVYETGEDYGFPVTLENQDLIDDVNAALADIRADGTWDALFEEWIPEEWYAGELD